MKKTFHEIERELADLTAVYEDTKELIDDPDKLKAFEADFNKKFDAILSEESDKIDGYGIIIGTLEAEKERLAGIEKSMSSRKRVVGNRIDILKKRFLETMTKNDKDKIEGQVYIARIRHNKSLVVPNVMALPPKWKEKVFIYTAKNDAIKKALKDGKAISGATLKETDSVTIKAS